MGSEVTVSLIQANSRTLPLADNSVDLVVTSPPYFALRSYQDGGVHYEGQVGDEPTPAEFIRSLLVVTSECVRVLKPEGSLWVNLGDKYARSGGGGKGSSDGTTGRGPRPPSKSPDGVREKSLIGVPWRYALACIDELGLILRAEVIWDKPNGMPESVTDRVRRSHEQWFHFTLSPRYFSAVDEIRETHSGASVARATRAYNAGDQFSVGTPNTLNPEQFVNPLGKLPGSVWTVATEPLRVPESLGTDHFAAFPIEFPRRIIQGWSPTGICNACGEGRTPVAEVDRTSTTPRRLEARSNGGSGLAPQGGARGDVSRVITAYECGCPDTSAPTRPAVVLDPFGGTGTTAMVADVLGRHGISVDMSADYCRIAEWRTNDPNERARAARVAKPPAQTTGQDALFDI